MILKPGKTEGPIYSFMGLLTWECLKKKTMAAAERGIWVDPDFKL